MSEITVDMRARDAVFTVIPALEETATQRQAKYLTGDAEMGDTGDMGGDQHG